MSIYPYIASRIVYPVGDMIFGTHIMKSLKELERKQWWTVEAIKANQDSRLNKLIKHSYENVPYLAN